MDGIVGVLTLFAIGSVAVVGMTIFFKHGRDEPRWAGQSHEHLSTSLYRRYLPAMRVIQAIAAVFVAVATGVAVYWIRYGTEAWLGTLSDNMLALAGGLIIIPLASWCAWREVRALIEGRQQRQQAGRRD